MIETQVLKKILWAVDPFSEESKLQESAALAVHALTTSEETEIEPIYLLNQSPLGIPINLPPEVVAQTCDAAQEKVNEILSPIQLKNILPVKVLTRSYMSQKEISDDLIHYAKQTKTDLIVTSTHGKAGVRRWFTGSFVENLMLYSDVPLFIVNPHWKSEADFKNVLFPTDFSDESLSAFNNVLNLTKSLKSNLIIFHQIPYVLSPYIQSAFSVYPMYKEAFEQEIAEKQKEATRLADLAREQGVQTHSYIDYRLRGSAAEAILSYAKKKHCVVAITARSGRLSTNLLGSTTRKVVRGAIYPVWVIHPDYRAKEFEQEKSAA